MMEWRNSQSKQNLKIKDNKLLRFMQQIKNNNKRKKLKKIKN